MKKPFYKRIWFWVIVVLIAFIALCVSVSGDDDDSSSSSKTSSSKTTSSKKSDTSKKSSQSSSKAKKDYKTYNDSEADNNASKITEDDFKNSDNIGKSLHYANAKIARVDKSDGGLWIQSISDDSNINAIHVQAINLASYNFQEGDIVDIKATIQGMEPSMVTFKGDKDTYPTIWIHSIDKVQ